MKNLTTEDVLKFILITRNGDLEELETFTDPKVLASRIRSIPSNKFVGIQLERGEEHRDVPMTSLTQTVEYLLGGVFQF